MRKKENKIAATAKPTSFQGMNFSEKKNLEISSYNLILWQKEQYFIYTILAIPALATNLGSKRFCLNKCLNKHMLVKIKESSCLNLAIFIS